LFKLTSKTTKAVTLFLALCHVKQLSRKALTLPSTDKTLLSLTMFNTKRFRLNGSCGTITSSLSRVLMTALKCE
jgi:hypothetical protein